MLKSPAVVKDLQGQYEKYDAIFMQIISYT